MSNFTNTMNSDQYRPRLCHPWRKSPDFLEKRPNFVSYWVRRNFINIVKCCLQLIPIHVCPLVNSATNATHEVVSFSVENARTVGKSSTPV